MKEFSVKEKEKEKIEIYKNITSNI